MNDSQTNKAQENPKYWESKILAAMFGYVLGIAVFAYSHRMEFEPGTIILYAVLSPLGIIGFIGFVFMRAKNFKQVNILQIPKFAHRLTNFYNGRKIEKTLQFRAIF